MKTTTLAAVLLMTPLSLLAQGKVNLINDAASLIVLPTDTSVLLTADRVLAGQAVGNAVPLRSGVTLVLGLYGGTSSSRLYLYSTIALNNPAWPGGYIPSMHIVLKANPTTGAPAIPGIANGAAITAATPWFQVKYWDSRFASFEAALGAGGTYLGLGAMFQFNPGPSLSYPSTAPPSANSTWTDGNIVFYTPPYCYPSSVSFWSQPTNQTVVQNAGVVFWVNASTAGTYPLTYQWYFNGAPIYQANFASFGIASVQPTNAGIYSVVAYNPCASATSASATLTVLVPPHLTATPLSQTAEEGDTVGFSASATGDRPLMYQWFFNSTTPASVASTNTDLQLPHVQSPQVGAYAVVVNNLAGAVTSPPAMLAVIPPVPRRMVPALSLIGQVGAGLNLDYAPSAGPLPNWTTFDSVILTNPAQWYFDLSASLPAQRFYRAWEANPVSPPSAVGLHMLPALQLSGAVGNSWRIDYINRLGPINAWTTLDTVTLTNASQLYVDTSVIGQPPRLWRLVPLP